LSLNFGKRRYVGASDVLSLSPGRGPSLRQQSSVGLKQFDDFSTNCASLPLNTIRTGRMHGRVHDNTLAFDPLGAKVAARETFRHSVPELVPYGADSTRTRPYWRLKRIRNPSRSTSQNHSWRCHMMAYILDRT